MINIQIDENEIIKLRKQFASKNFRYKNYSNIKDECFNCGNKENLTLHHIVPISLGGTNNVSNIANLCPICHEKAHLGYDDLKNIGIFKAIKNNSLGRKKLVEYNQNTENILHRYFNLEIGTKEAKCLLGMSSKTKNTWYNILNIYKKKYSIPDNFKNKIDILNAQENKKGCIYIEYNDTVEHILKEYFSSNIGLKEARKSIGISEKTSSSWKRLVSIYKSKFFIPDDFSNKVDTINIQEERIKTTQLNILRKKEKQLSS
ncbi:TPA: HNH endonuclease [Clostridioides difficile]|nr:HNH endonuclease [Clostridioides difficile]